EYYCANVDSKTDTFFIDPDIENPRAIHVYEKAGFELVGNFIMRNSTFFKDQQSLLMVKKIAPLANS
nr:GNAT family N-acetyltransferase [Parachlamydiaceae bacterium]